MQARDRLSKIKIKNNESKKEISVVQFKKCETNLRKLSSETDR